MLNQISSLSRRTTSSALIQHINSRWMRLILFAWVLLCASQASAQEVDTAWVRVRQDLNWYRAWDIAVDASLNVSVTGGYSAGITALKYRPDGTEAWVATFFGDNNSNGDNRPAVAVDTSGNVYLAGSGSGAALDMMAVKLRSTGGVNWRRLTSCSDSTFFDDRGADVAVDKDGNVYITGSIDCSFGNGQLFTTIKYSPQGSILWRRQQGEAPSEGTSITVGNDGYVYAAGYNNFFGGNGYCVTKCQDDGDTAWVRTYRSDSTSSDVPVSVAVDKQGNVFVTGTSDNAFSINGADFLTIKYFSSGDTAWVRTYNGPFSLSDQARGLVVDDSGGVIVTGRSDGITQDYATIRYRSDGSVAWIQRYDGDGEDDPGGIAVDWKGNVYVTGASVGIGTDTDWLTIKYSSSGEERWVRRDGAASNDDADAITVDSLLNVYVAGYMPTASGSFATAKYNQQIALRTQGDHAHVGFNYRVGSNSSPPETLVIVTDGQSDLPWSLIQAAPWLSVNKSAGTTLDTLILSVNDYSLPSGIYQGQLSLRSPFADNSPYMVEVSLHVEASVEATNQVTSPGSVDSLALYISHDTISGFFIPLTFAEADSLNGKLFPSGLRVDSLRINPYYLDFGATYEIDNVLKRIVVSAPQGDAPIPAPDTAGTPMLARIYYTVDSAAVPQLVVFDTVRIACPSFDPGSDSCSIKFYLPDGSTLIPNFKPGKVLISSKLELGAPSEGYFETDQPRLGFGVNETTKKIALMHLGYQSLQYTAAAQADYVSIAPSGGVTPTELTVTVNSGMPAGLYRDTIEVSGPHGVNVLKTAVLIRTGFLCGDADARGSVDITDVVYLIKYIFAGGLAPKPFASGDLDCNESVTLGDVLYLVNYIFESGPDPCEACK